MNENEMVKNKKILKGCVETVSQHRLPRTLKTNNNEAADNVNEHFVAMV